MPTWPRCAPSTPKHRVQPRQHLSTFSPPARRLNSGQTHLALIARSCLISGLQSHPAFLPFASPFGKSSLSWYLTRIFRAESALRESVSALKLQVAASGGSYATKLPPLLSYLKNQASFKRNPNQSWVLWNEGPYSKDIGGRYSI